MPLAGSLSFSDFVDALHRPVALTRSDTWSLQDPIVLPRQIQLALEPRVRAHVRVRMPEPLEPREPSTLLLAGASPIEQKSVALWLTQRLGLRLSVFDACDLNEADPGGVEEELAALVDGSPSFVAIRNVDVLASPPVLALLDRRSSEAFVLGTAGVDAAPGAALLKHFATMLDWNVCCSSRAAAQTPGLR